MEELSKYTIWKSLPKELRSYLKNLDMCKYKMVKFHHYIYDKQYGSVSGALVDAEFKITYKKYSIYHKCQMNFGYDYEDGGFFYDSGIYPSMITQEYPLYVTLLYTMSSSNLS